MGATESRVRCAAKKFSEFDMPAMKPTTARDARPAAKFSPTADFPGCWDRIGPAHLKNWKPCTAGESAKYLLPFRRVILLIVNIFVRIARSLAIVLFALVSCAFLDR